MNYMFYAMPKFSSLLLAVTSRRRSKTKIHLKIFPLVVLRSNSVIRQISTGDEFVSNLALETGAKFDILSCLYPKFFLKFADIA